MSYTESLRTGSGAMKNNITALGSTASLFSDKSSDDTGFEFKNIMNDFSVSARDDEPAPKFSNISDEFGNGTPAKSFDEHDPLRAEDKHGNASGGNEEKHVAKDEQDVKKDTANHDSGEEKETKQKKEKHLANDLSLAEILASKTNRIDFQKKSVSDKADIPAAVYASEAKKAAPVAEKASGEVQKKTQTDKNIPAQVIQETAAKHTHGTAGKTATSEKTSAETVKQASAQQTTASAFKGGVKNQGASFALENNGIRFTKISVSGTAADSEQAAGNGMELLKNLASRQSAYVATTGTTQAKGQAKKGIVNTADADQILTPDSKSKSADKTTLQGTVSASASNTTEKTSVKKEFSDSREGTKNAPNGDNGRGMMNLADTGSSVSALNSARGSAGQVSGSSMSQLMDVVNNIATQVQSALKGEGIERKQQLSLEIQSDELGNISISIKKSGETLSINLQMDNDSAKEQLAGQKGELKEQLKELGFSSVDIEVGLNDNKGGMSGDSRGGGKEAAKSNADSIENVKLAGNAEADLSQILEMQ